LKNPENLKEERNERQRLQEALIPIRGRQRDFGMPLLLGEAMHRTGSIHDQLPIHENDIGESALV